MWWIMEGFIHDINKLAIRIALTIRADPLFNCYSLLILGQGIKPSGLVLAPEKVVLLEYEGVTFLVLIHGVEPRPVH